MRQRCIRGGLEAFEELFFRLSLVVIAFLLVQYSFYMEPILIRSHLIQKRASLALLQLLLHLCCDVLQSGELIEAYDVKLAMRVGSAVLLVFVADLQRYSSAQGSSAWSHITAEEILASPRFIIAARTLWTHAEAQ